MGLLLFLILLGGVVKSSQPPRTSQGLPIQEPMRKANEHNVLGTQIDTESEPFLDSDDSHLLGVKRTTLNTSVGTSDQLDDDLFLGKIQVINSSEANGFLKNFFVSTQEIYKHPANEFKSSAKALSSSNTNPYLSHSKDPSYVIPHLTTHPPIIGQTLKYPVKPDCEAVGTNFASAALVTGGASSSVKEATLSKDALSVEYRLSKDLLTNYDKHVRPVKQANDTTHVFMELSLYNILKMNTKDQTLTTNAELITKWIDAHLKWNPIHYSNISIINLPAIDIWQPDIILYNTAETNYRASVLQTNAIVRYDGTVELASHTIFTSTCNVDTQWYPFDQQQCHLHFASWTYDSTQIYLTMGPADISEYSENPEFFLENFFVDQKEMFNPCCKKPMSGLIYHVQIQRRTIFSLFFYLMPGVLINICALLVFILPVESGEKISLGINSMLAMIVFLMAMSERLPVTEKIPLAGMYYGVCLSLVTLNIAFSVAVLNVNFAGNRGKKVPNWLRYFSVWLAKCLAMKLPVEIKHEWALDKENNILKTTMVEPLQDFDLCSFSHQKRFPYPGNEDGTKLNNELKDAFQRRSIFALETLINHCRDYRREQLVQREIENLKIQWMFISRVLDRALSIIFFVSAFIFTISILTSSPFNELFEYCPIGPMDACANLTRAEILEMAKLMTMEHATH